MKHILLALCACLVAATAWPTYGGNAEPVTMASLSVKGTINVSPAGYVTGYAMYKPDELPAVVVNLLNRAIPNWRFQPVTYKGKPAAAKANMYIRLVARPIGKHRYSVSIVSTSFSPMDNTSDYTVTYAMGIPHAPPKYPPQALRFNVMGNVYLLLQINREGKVSKVATREVDLLTRGDPAAMQQWRKLLSHSAETAARHWRFQVNANPTDKNFKYWYASIPVAFRIGYGPQPSRKSGSYGWDVYGAWHPYIPGPRQFIPWADKHEMANVNTAQPSGSLHILGQGLHRIDPHGG